MTAREGTARNIPWETLSEVAWDARDNAFVLGDTKVGAAVFSDDGTISGGCNVEQVYRSHDIHAEVNAIGNMVARGGKRTRAVLIAAERELFTPCGACLDWIFQFGSGSCLVAFESRRGGERMVHRADELMPHYPR